MDHVRRFLRATLAAVVPMEERQWERLAPQLRVQRFAAGDHLQRAGEASTTVYFLSDGLVREYYLRTDGTERTRGFVRTGGFTAAYADFLLGRDADVSIQALQDTDTAGLPLRVLADLRRDDGIWEVVSRRLLEQMYLQKEKREFQFLTMSASERYTRLEEDFPGIERIVPQYHVASYLGITPVALSRIRGRLRTASKNRATSSSRSRR